MEEKGFKRATEALRKAGNGKKEIWMDPSYWGREVNGPGSREEHKRLS